MRRFTALRRCAISRVMTENATMRIDKWLWAVRLCKTRQQATDACRLHRVRMEGQEVKPARLVKPGKLPTPRQGRGPVIAGCSSYSRRFRTTEEARRWIHDLEADGHCPNVHRVEEPEVEVRG